MRRAFAALLLCAAPGQAQVAVTSPAPEAVSVTIYRSDSEELNLDWLEGYALITETRTVDLPAGPSELRFEGVAGGIIPVSAIVSGLPGGVAEKNRDARLLSPGGLVDAALGKRVHIRRTSRATGKVIETEAVLRSGPDGVILETAEGVEALQCSGLPETLVYDALPDGLTDKPTLAVRTESAVAARATLSLSYLATGFDWRANYVINLGPNGRKLDLFAWLTLANGNDESFAAAQTQAVAGAAGREEEEDDDLGESSVPTELSLRCWPAGTTSDQLLPPPPPPPPAVEGYAMEEGYDEIIVTGSRMRESLMSSPVAAITAEQEELGDLKLYRIPEPVTVAAHAQKQVALLTRPGVRFERIYAADVAARGDRDDEPAAILLRLDNKEERGLGVPLPLGTAAIFETVEGRPMLVGEMEIADTAVGQEIDLRVGESPQVRITQRELEREQRKDADGDIKTQRFEVEITNANPEPVAVEVLLRMFGERYRLVDPSRRLDARGGRHLWLAKVRANGRAKLAYTIKTIPEPDRAETLDEDD